MSIELQSSKMFASYFEDDASDSNSNGNLLSAASVTANDPSFAATNWPGSMTVVTAFLYLLGTSGLIGGLLAVRGLVNLEAAEILVSRIASHAPEAKMAAAMLAAQVENNIYFYCLFGFRILLGAGFLGVAGLITKQSDNANNLASLLLVLAMIYNLGFFAINFMTASSVLNVAGIDKSIAEAGLFAAMLFGGVWLLVKIAAYCGLAYYLTRPNIAALFSPTR